MAVVALLIAYDGRTSRTAPEQAGPPRSQVSELDRVVADVDAARAALLAALDAVVAAATAVDAADETCESGDRRRAAQARANAGSAASKVQAAFATLENQVDAYRSTLSTLTAATAALEPAQRQAVAEATAAGEREALALGEFLVSARRAWPAYERVSQVQATWVERASAGWYRSEAEAAAGYIVLRRPVLPALESAREALRQADADRRPATEQMRTAIARANAALDALRAPAG